MRPITSYFGRCLKNGSSETVEEGRAMKRKLKRVNGFYLADKINAAVHSVVELYSLRMKKYHISEIEINKLSESIFKKVMKEIEKL